MIFVFSVLGVAVVLFATEWVRGDVVAVLVLLSLAISGVLSPEEAFAGFSSKAVIAIGALLVVSAGLVRSGVVKWIADRLNVVVRDNRTLLVLVCTLIPGVLSGFINIVAAVTIFIPAVLRMAKKNGADPSALLLPMAVTGMVGANLTLIGASHNLVVDSLLQQAGESGLGFFEFTPVGAVLVALATLYSLVVGPWLLKGRNGADPGRETAKEDLVDAYGLDERLWEFFVKPGGGADGRSMKAVGMGRDFGLNPILIFRGEREIPVEDEEVTLREHDLLAVTGREERIRAFTDRREGITVLGRPDGHEEFSWSAFELVEVVVPPRSEAVGRTLRDLRMREDAGLTCIGVWRDDRPYRTGTRDRKLAPGDGLLLFGSREKVRAYRPEPEFRWLRRPREEEAPRHLRHLAPFAALIFLAVLVTAAVGWVSIAVAALAGAVLLMLIGVLTPGRAYQEIQWRTLVLIAGMYPLGTALEKTGAAEVISGLIVDTAGSHGSLYALVAVAFLAMLLTQPMHNAVAAVIMTPVAVKVAGALSSNPKAFAVAVIVGASASFLMPVGHPAPLLVREPGGYTIGDYLKFGLALNLAILGVIALLVPLLWPL